MSLTQPVPTEKLKELYTVRLEVIVAQKDLEDHARRVQAESAAFDRRLTELEKEYAFDRGDWNFDLKAGTMIPLPKKITRAMRRRGQRKAGKAKS